MKCVFSTSMSTVIATMRDLRHKDKLLEAAGQAYGRTLSVAQLDVCSDESVKRCISGIQDGHVDVLSEWLRPLVLCLKWTLTP